MNKLYASHNVSNRRCRDFAVTHKPLNATRRFDEYVKLLGGSIEAMSNAGSKISNNPISKARQDVRAARASLRQNLEGLRRIAHTLNFDDAGASKLFRITKQNVRLDTEISTAKEILEGARKHKTFFIEHGMAADFLEQLSRSISTIDAVFTVVNGIRDIRTGARQAMDKAYMDARRAKSGLNGIFHVVYVADAEKLTAWQAAYQVEYRRNPKAKVQPEGSEVKAA